MAVALQKHRLLETLYTDLYLPNSLSNLRMLPGLSNGLAALLGRNHRDLPFYKVHTFSILGVQFRLRIRQTRNFNERLSLLNKYGSIFAKHVGENVIKSRPDILVAFTGAAKETFEKLCNAKSQTLKILDQVDPGLFDYSLVLDECNKYPQWGEGGEPLNLKYLDRVKEEICLADHIVVNSNYSRDLLRQWVGEKNFSVLPIPSSFERKAKTKLNSNGHLKVLFLGTLSLRKGVHYSLNAVEQMSKSGFDISLTLAGACYINPEMLLRFKSCNYVGAVPSDVVKNLLDSHDVLLFPTISEGFGIVQVEAISRGLPVITTKNCGQVIEDGISGIIINAMSSEEIIEGLSTYYYDRKLLAEHSRNAFNRSQVFSSDSYAVQLVKCIENIYALHI